MRWIGWIFVTMLVLAGCGGGGSSSSTSTTPTPVPSGPACSTGTNLALAFPNPGGGLASSSSAITLYVASSGAFGGYGFAVYNSSYGTVFGGSLSGGSAATNPPPAGSATPSFTASVYYSTTLPSILPAGYTWTVELYGSNCTAAPITGATFST